MTVLSAAADVAVEKTATGFAVRSGDVRRTLDFYGPNTLRVKSDLGRDHWKHPSLAIVAKPSAVAAKLRETADAFVVEGAAFTVSIDRKNGALTFSGKGKVLLREPSDPCTIKEINIDGEPTYEVTQRRFPSWLYSIDQGATTMWERWGRSARSSA